MGASVDFRKNILLLNKPDWFVTDKFELIAKNTLKGRALKAFSKIFRTLSMNRFDPTHLRADKVATAVYESCKAHCTTNKSGLKPDELTSAINFLVKLSTHIKNPEMQHKIFTQMHRLIRLQDKYQGFETKKHEQGQQKEIAKPGKSMTAQVDAITNEKVMEGFNGVKTDVFKKLFAQNEGLNRLPLLDLDKLKNPPDHAYEHGSIDFLKPEDLSHPIMKGLDKARRPFVSLKIQNKRTNESFVVTLYKVHNDISKLVSFDPELANAVAFGFENKKAAASFENIDDGIKNLRKILLSKHPQYEIDLGSIKVEKKKGG